MDIQTAGPKVFHYKLYHQQQLEGKVEFKKYLLELQSLLVFVCLLLCTRAATESTSSLACPLNTHLNEKHKADGKSDLLYKER